jgi:glyoxylase-like metal-dependent hydrolase (beta-lactamase superfamily II)
MLKLSNQLYEYENTCNVYVVKSGAEAVLIDFGDGSVLDELPGIGVERVSGIFMTHHHRDQGQGLFKAVEAGIPIFVPHTEQDLFCKINEHWQAREIMNNYNVRQDRFSLLHSVPISGTLRDYASISIGEHTFQIIPTPGHTTGSITIMVQIEGRQIAFTGDLIAAPGKVWSMSATQWTYNGAEGVAASVASLLDLKDRLPDVLLPSHGKPIERPNEAIDLLIERFWKLLQYRKQNPRLFQLREKPYEEVLPHVLKSRASMANYYVVLSGSGKALLIDFGYDFLTGIPAGADRASRRPWLYCIGKLKSEYGVKSIDTVLLTHYHDDHVAGCNVLRDVEGSQIWAAENFADILEHPTDYDLPCLWYDPIPVDRKLPLQRKIQWEEYEFTLYAQPGHTLYAVAIAFEADGKRVLAVGDQQQGNEGLLWNYVYQNRFQYDDYVQSAALYRKLQPDVIVSGHWDPLWVKPGYWDELEEYGQVLEQLHRELLPLDEVDFGAEGFAARFRPYQIETNAGASFSCEVEVVNPYEIETDMEIGLVLPDGWTAEESNKNVRVAGKGRRSVCFNVTVPDIKPTRRIRMGASITAGTTTFGQQAEALIHVTNH